jgi:transcriptional regulator with XRE-family HTH domain
MFADENAAPESLDRGALIGARLRHRRLELGMTARELARRVDCSPSLISQVERGRAVPSVSTLWALVTALRISMDRCGMHHVGHVDWDFCEPPAGYAGSAEGYSSSCLVGGHTGAVHTDLSISKLKPGGWPAWSPAGTWSSTTATPASPT